MADAFDHETFHIECNGHHPHLRIFETTNKCEEIARTILLGASNRWFPLVMSALSLPPKATERLLFLVEENWTELKDIPSLEVTKYVTASSRMPLLQTTSEQIWTSIQEHKHTKSQSEANDVDLKIAEWDTLTQYPVPPPTKDFRVSRIKPPVGFEHLFEETILLELLREVECTISL